MTEQCVASDGLINPALFPAKSADLDPAAITRSASSMRTMGQAVEDRTTTVSTTWGRLPACYRAPEQEAVYTVMSPAVTSATSLRTRFADAARHLDTYAGALEAIKPRLADLERRAAAFRKRVVGGVWVDASAAANASFWDHLGGIGDYIPGVTERRVKVSWKEDQDSVDENTRLLGEYAQILSDVSAAVAACANGINGLNTNVCTVPVETIPAAAFTAGETPMPWGSPVVEDRNCRESVGNGAYTFGRDLVQGAGQLIVGYNPANGDWFSGDAYGQAWGGLGDLVGSIVVLASPVGWVAAGMAATGNNDNGFSEWMYDRAVTVRNAGGALVGWDPNAKDGWHAWKEDGLAAGTSAVLSVGTFFIPGAGQVGAGLKAGSVGARVARVSGAVSEFAVQGGSWVVKGGVKVVTGLRTAFKFDLDGFGGGFGPQVAVAGAGAGVRVNPFAGLLNAMTEGPSTSAGTAGRTPVRDAFFGPREAPVDGPRVEAPRADVPGGSRGQVLDTPRVDGSGGGARPEAPDGPRAEVPAVRDPLDGGADRTPVRDPQGPEPLGGQPEVGPGAGDDLPAELQGVDLSDAASVERVLDEMVDQAADVSDSAAFDKLAAEKIAMFERLAARQDEGSFLRQLFNGSKFNWENYHRYEYREVLVEVADPGPPPTAQRFRVDSYSPGDEIVSRKLTQLAQVQERTALSYIDELVRKYNPDNADLKVLGTDRNVAQFGARAGEIVDGPLDGLMVLEIPVQHGEIPTAVLKHAALNDVVIRDVTGRVYRHAGVDAGKVE
ncbi:hypothetical protein [Cellulomonas dongxiuzhuiae]|uniref:WXG100 family type VII secretion target n=1 Tax=Cellulomonas dongxiuzhuiae TaxID=2819979 RepID=A0ABX8GKF3_9CELL|nr:hypothetical protein [Cellulomonas dongxiuzhuiae]MBO3095618.1 hypothetical protein [Cellulomonas dongxiuzhuiae]QWC16584.1 hypothetical protein KKR89_02645 [Cellulomonas dongxiuzhuiae]